MDFKNEDKELLMISFRQADLIERLHGGPVQEWKAKLDLVYPYSGPHPERYAGIASLELSPSIPLYKYMKIRDMVNAAIAPVKATIDDNPDNDSRVFYSNILETGAAFIQRTSNRFNHQIASISKYIVTMSERDEGDTQKRVTIGFVVEA